MITQCPIIIKFQLENRVTLMLHKCSSINRIKTNRDWWQLLILLEIGRVHK